MAEVLDRPPVMLPNDEVIGQVADDAVVRSSLSFLSDPENADLVRDMRKDCLMDLARYVRDKPELPLTEAGVALAVLEKLVEPVFPPEIVLSLGGEVK